MSILDREEWKPSHTIDCRKREGRTEKTNVSKKRQAHKGELINSTAIAGWLETIFRVRRTREKKLQLWPLANEHGS